MTFDDRLSIALERVRLVYERRGNFVSDSDLLDTADLFTTDELGPDGLYPEDGDRDALLDHLYAEVFPEEVS